MVRREGVELVTIHLFVALHLRRVHLVLSRLFEAKNATKRIQCRKYLLAFSESDYNLACVLYRKNHCVASQKGRNHLGTVRDRNCISWT